MKQDGFQKKGWGYEIIWANNDTYCGKILCFERPQAKTSMHFHKNKEKNWFINAGQFMLRYVDTSTSETKEQFLKEGDTWHVPPLQPHQLIAMQPNSIVFEVSSTDDTDDTYRITPGDGQKL